MSNDRDNTDKLNTSASTENYEVGYGKPPQHTRFKKGRSGNPRGRSKGALNMVNTIQRALAEKVVVNDGGRRKTITKAQAMITQQVNKAASGDPRAFTLLMPFLVNNSATPETTFDSAIDRQLAEAMMKRMQGSTSKPADDVEAN